MKEISRIEAIRTYFGMGARDAIKEIKRLSEEDKQELGELACIELGCKLKVLKKK